jgi:hypothetical protein
MMKQLALALTFAFATTGVACKKDEAKPAAKKEEPKKEEPKKEEPKTTPPTTDPKTVDQAGGDMAKHAADIQAAVDMGQYSLGDGNKCEAYGKEVQGWFAELGTEWKRFQDNAQTEGAPAFRRLGEFLKKGSATLKGVKADGDLGTAHGQLVTAFDEMGSAFIEVADKIQAQDQAGAQAGVQKIQTAGTKLGAAFEALKKACGA